MSAQTKKKQLSFTWRYLAREAGVAFCGHGLGTVVCILPLHLIVILDGVEEGPMARVDGQGATQFSVHVGISHLCGGDVRSLMTSQIG